MRLMTLIAVAALALIGSAGAAPTSFETMNGTDRVQYQKAQERVKAGEDVYIFTGAKAGAMPIFDVVALPGGVPGLKDYTLYRCYKDEKGTLQAQEVPWSVGTCPGGRCSLR